MTAVGLLLAGAGALLLWSAATGENPVAAVRDVLTGREPSGELLPGVERGQPTAPDTSPVAAPAPGGGGGTGWRRPAHGPISPGGRFGAPRSGGTRQHAGLDFAVPEGTPIVAARAGTVVAVGWRGGYGFTVALDHEHGWSTLYAHLQERRVVTPGESVIAGEVVGVSGNTGRSTGPHLHFEIRRNGEALDPEPLLAAGSVLA